MERRTQTRSSVLGDGDVEGTAWDVFVPPFDDEDVAALILDRVCDVVHPVAHVFDVHLLTGRLRPVDPHHQHVGACRVVKTSVNVFILRMEKDSVVLVLTCFAAVNCEHVLLTYEGLRQAGTSGDDFTCV